MAFKKYKHFVQPIVLSGRDSEPLSALFLFSAKDCKQLSVFKSSFTLTLSVLEMDMMTAVWGCWNNLKWEEKLLGKL